MIKHVDYEDEGDYTCEASNGVGIAKSYSISLAVHASPYFTKVTLNYTQRSNSLLCYASEIMYCFRSQKAKPLRRGSR